MKKFFSLLLSAVMLSSLASPTAFADEKLSFFESYENLLKLKSYENQQVFSGNVKLSNLADELEGGEMNFRLSFNSDVVNKKAFEPDTKATMSGRLTMNLEGEDKPFDSLIFRIRGEFRSFGSSDIYMKLNQLELKATGVPNDEMDDYLEFQDMLNEELTVLRGRWFHLPISELEQEFALDELEGFETEAILESFRKKGVQETYEDLVDSALESMVSFGEISEEDSRQAQKLLDEFLNTKLFTQREIRAGKNKGMTHFAFSKRRFVSFLGRVANIMGEEMSARDLREINSMLRKFHLSGMYSANQEERIYDHFKLKFILKNLDLLDELELHYSNKVTNINKPLNVERPRDSENLLESGLPLFGPTFDDEFDDFDEFDFDEDEFFFDDEDFFLEEPMIIEEMTKAERVDVRADDDAFLGDKNAPVTVIEFTDYECPFCRQFSEQTFPEIMEKYIDTGKVKWVVRDFPLAFHSFSKETAMAAECVREQSNNKKYFEYRDLVFANQENLNSENLRAWAHELVADDSRFNRCLNTGKFEAEVEKDLADGETAGVAGTPNFFVNGIQVMGAVNFSTLQEIIEEELR